MIPIILRQFDDLLAEKVMGWRLRNCDWYLVDEDDPANNKWRAERLWSPTRDANASQLVLLACLAFAHEHGFEITMSVDNAGRYHASGNHPVLARQLVIDSDWNLAICRFAARLFGISAPEPYDHNPSASGTMYGVKITIEFMTGITQEPQPVVEQQAKKILLEHLRTNNLATFLGRRVSDSSGGCEVRKVP